MKPFTITITRRCMARGLEQRNPTSSQADSSHCSQQGTLEQAPSCLRPYEFFPYGDTFPESFL